MKNKQELYENFVNRKNNGEILDINKLSRNELKQLWYYEIIFDKEIAQLFNTTEYKVKKKRNEMNLLFHNCLIEDFKQRCLINI